MSLRWKQRLTRHLSFDSYAYQDVVAEVLFGHVVEGEERLAIPMVGAVEGRTARIRSARSMLCHAQGAARRRRISES